MSGVGQACGEALFGGSRFIRWSLSPFLIVFAAAMPMLLQKWTTTAIAVLVVVEFLCAALLAGFWLPAKYGHWCFRLVGGSVFLIYCCYFVNEWIVQGHPLQLIEPRGNTSPRNALLGLIIFGLPGLQYALFGRFVGRERPGYVRGEN